MAVLADYVGRQLKAPVTDDTGLKGLFDFRLGYQPDLSASEDHEDDDSPHEAKLGPTLPQALSR
jgi:uncharacterized protein (TIGR03435 family)